MLKEFKDFINKGNVLDLAVAVILGAAFGNIIGSMVDDLLMPIIGSMFKINFTDWKYTLQDAVVGADGKEISAAINFGIGKFIQTLINFILVAFPVFLIVKAVNRSKKAEPAPAPPVTETLLAEIRDLLKK